MDKETAHRAYCIIRKIDELECVRNKLQSYFHVSKLETENDMVNFIKFLKETEGLYEIFNHSFSEAGKYITDEINEWKKALEEL